MLERSIGEPAAAKCFQETPVPAPGYLVRQPILDRRGVVLGYELLFHQGSGKPDALGTARHGILDALDPFGIGRFTSGSRAFLNCSVESLVEDAWDGLPTAHIVLQIPTPTETSSRLVRVCRTLRDAGFQLP